MYSHEAIIQSWAGALPLASLPAAAGRSDGITRTKSKQINMRLTERDYERIKRRAVKAKVNLSAYMLTMALEGEIVLVEGLPDVAKQLRFIGNNLNQITRLCHQGQIQCVNLAETREEVEALWQSLSSQIRRVKSKR